MSESGQSKRRRGKPSADISGRKFYRLTALYPTERRDSRGSVIWHCRCDCGNELDISYSDLLYSNRKSCGCQKKEHNKKLKSLLTHVSGTSLDALKSKKIPVNNTTGVKGVYLIKGKYVAKIVFQKKAYYLGTYELLEDAAAARHAAEVALNDHAVLFYQRWRQLAAQSEEWAKANPIQMNVERNEEGRLYLLMKPELSLTGSAESEGESEGSCTMEKTEQA